MTSEGLLRKSNQRRPEIFANVLFPASFKGDIAELIIYLAVWKSRYVSKGIKVLLFKSELHSILLQLASPGNFEGVPKEAKTQTQADLTYIDTHDRVTLSSIKVADHNDNSVRFRFQ